MTRERIASSLARPPALRMTWASAAGAQRSAISAIGAQTLVHENRRRGATPAGNHAQGVAYHAGRLGIPATIVMPEGTPFTKIDRTEAFGAAVLLKGDSLAAAQQAALTLGRERGLVLVHPYDDPAVVA